ncbi:MAG: pyridoxal 5'-phosphate synthase glutaminase subunit PdxT [Candidatus Dormibacteria bacterium]
MTIATIGVLALQGDVREHLAAFGRSGASAVPVRLAAELDKVDALAIPGGESTTMHRLLRVFGLRDTLGERLAAGMPTFTTCAGLILLSREIRDGRPDQEPYGAHDVAVRRNAYGSQVDSFEADLDVEGIDGGAFRGVFIRAPRIVDLGPRTLVVARLNGDPVAVRTGPHLGLTFHPEMSGDDRLHRAFVEWVDGDAEVSAA